MFQGGGKLCYDCNHRLLQTWPNEVHNNSRCKLPFSLSQTQVNFHGAVSMKSPRSVISTFFGYPLSQKGVLQGIPW